MGKLISYYTVTNDDVFNFKKEVLPLLEDNIKETWDVGAYIAGGTSDSIYESIKDTIYTYVESRLDELIKTTFSDTAALTCRYFVDTDFRRCVYEFLKDKHYDLKSCAIVYTAIEHIEYYGNLNNSLGNVDYDAILKDIIDPITACIRKRRIIIEGNEHE